MTRATTATGRERPGMHDRSSRYYCERCADTGMVSVERIAFQPEALRCSCYRMNPVIRARHQRFNLKASTKQAKGGRRGSLL